MSLQITPAVSYLPVDLHKSLKAEAILEDGSVLDVTADPAVQWSSSDPDVATVDQGIVTGHKVGTVIITASGEANGQSFSETVKVNITNRIVTDLQITPKKYDLPIGIQKDFEAIATLDNGDKLPVTTDSTVKWSSDAEDIATVDQGTVTGHKVGTATITASGVANGKTFRDSAVVTITPETVKELQINGHAGTLPLGQTKNLTAQVRMSNGVTHDVTTNQYLNWESSDEKIATISPIGFVTAISAGTVEFTASGVVNNTQFRDTTRLRITPAFVQSLAILDKEDEPIVAPNNLAAGLHQQLRAQATMSDTTLEDVTEQKALNWVSSHSDVATIDQKGEVTAHKPGTATITARYITDGQPDVVAAAVVTVTDAFVTSLAILNGVTNEPFEAPIELPVGGIHLELLAKATLSDRSTANVTTEDDLTWTSEFQDVASIDDEGVVEALAVGQTTITATYKIDEENSVKEDIVVRVTNDVFVERIEVEPSDNVMLVGGYVDLTAVAIMSKGENRNVTTDVSWESDERSIAIVDDSGPNKGRVTGQGLGRTTITATYDGSVVGEAAVVVTGSLLAKFDTPDTTTRDRTDAFSHCRNKPGYRLPTIKELRDLFTEQTAANPTSNIVMCTENYWPLNGQCGGASNRYWSSEASLFGGAFNTAYIVDMRYGTQTWGWRTTHYHVACINPNKGS
ncbi:Ig-like domain-containing protein [Aeromonas popoffii]|uniref:Ig-like domain-containing protein n=1 Tax=Aeromonas popoffii TaxID=70856 RepID=UPI0030CF4EB1